MVARVTEPRFEEQIAAAMEQLRRARDMPWGDTPPAGLTNSTGLLLLGAFTPIAQRRWDMRAPDIQEFTEYLQAAYGFYPRMAERVPIREGQAFLRLALGEPEFAELLEVDEMLRMAVEFLLAFQDELGLSDDDVAAVMRELQAGVHDHAAEGDGVRKMLWGGI